MRWPLLAAVLSLLNEATGKDFGSNSFESRLRTQKAIYLLAAFDYEPAKVYPFSQYFRGPYSSKLAREYYAMSKSISKKLPRAPPIPAATLAAIQAAVARDNEFLEAAATMHLIAANERCPPAQLPKRLQETKPRIPQGTANEALHFLRSHGLIQG